MTCMVAKYTNSFPDNGIGISGSLELERQVKCSSPRSKQLGMALEELEPELEPAANGSTGEEEPKLFSAVPLALQTAANPLQFMGAGGHCNWQLEVGSCTPANQSRAPPRKHLGFPKPWWEGQLAEGIHRTLKNREIMLDTINLASPQLHKRADLIDFISSICKCLPVSNTTRHLAVLLLDHFMEKHDIMDYRLKLVGLTCLLVAAKMEDRDEHLPSIGHLRRLSRLENMAEYSKDEFQRMELYLMKFFDWSVSYPTTAHFIGYYNANCFRQDTIAGTEDLSDLPFCLGGAETDFLDEVGADFDLDNVNTMCSEYELKDVEGWDMPMLQREQRDLASLRYQLEEVTASFLEKALRDYRFLGYPPSVVAAAAVYATRIHMSVSPSWTARLESVSHCSKQLLSPVVELLICT